MILRLWRFNINTSLGKSPKGYTSRKDGGLIGYWLEKYTLQPESMMVVVSDSKMLEEMAPEMLYRNAPKDKDDAIVLVVNSKKIEFAFHVGQNIGWLVPPQVVKHVEGVVDFHFSSGRILLGIREAIKAVHFGAKQASTEK